MTVTVFHGPAENQVSLHAYTPTLGAANTQVVLGRIVDKAPDPGFGPALIVDDAPDLGGDAFMLTLFDATIPASSKTFSDAASPRPTRSATSRSTTTAPRIRPTSRPSASRRSQRTISGRDLASLTE